METDFRLIERHKKAISQRSSGEKRKTLLQILKDSRALSINNLRRALVWASDEDERRELQETLDLFLSRTKKKATEKRQTDLDNLLPPLRLIVDRMPNRPYCTDSLDNGLKIRPKIVAIQKRYVQHNPPAMLGCLALDLDYDVNTDAPAWEKSGVMQPNILIFNQKNGHAHALYLLKDPVCTTEYAHRKPIRYAKAILGAYGSALNADPGYVGLIIKNPLHKHWKNEIINPNPYTLEDLAGRADLKKSNQQSVKFDQGLGRNVALFENCRVWAYKEVRDYWKPGGYEIWGKAVLHHIETLNQGFPHPLPYSEVKALAKSISKWVWEHFSPIELQDLIQRTHQPARQAERGRKAKNQATAGVASGEARRAARQQERDLARSMREQGMTHQDIADALRVSLRTVKYWTAG